MGRRLDAHDAPPQQQDAQRQQALDAQQKEQRHGAVASANDDKTLAPLHASDHINHAPQVVFAEVGAGGQA